MLCELGANFWRRLRSGGGCGANEAPRRPGEVEFIQDFYSQQYANHEGDFVCCKMTLEHIAPTGDFVGAVRRAVGDDPQTVVFFQVPDVIRILDGTVPFGTSTMSTATTSVQAR